MPGFGIGMINGDFHIAEIRQAVAERLKRVVMYTIALGPRCFKWKSLSGPKALLFLQFLIAFITRSVVNVRTISNRFLLVSLVTTLVSLQEECLSSFEVLNCLLNLVASCLDDANEIPLKVIASFSAPRFALPSIILIVIHNLVRSVFSPWFQQSLYIFSVCAHIYASGWLYSISAVQVRWGLFYGGHLVCSSRPVSLLVQVPHGVCGVHYGCGVMLLCVQRYEIYSHLFSSLLEENACSGRPLLLVCIYPSWPFLGSHRFDVGMGWRASSSVI